jgi:hypothetical protein
MMPVPDATLTPDVEEPADQILVLRSAKTSCKISSPDLPTAAAALQRPAVPPGEALVGVTPNYEGLTQRVLPPDVIEALDFAIVSTRDSRQLRSYSSFIYHRLHELGHALSDVRERVGLISSEFIIRKENR